MVRNIQYTSIKRVLDNLLDHPLLRDVDLDQAIRYALRFIELHGYPQLFEDKLADVEIHQFRGELPCDLISIQQVRDKCTGVCLRAMTKSFNPGLKDYPKHRHRHPNGFPPLANGKPVPPYMDGMDRACDHPHPHIDPFPGHEMSFKTQGRIIYTSFPEGVVEMAYKAIPVDEDGYPLLIDDENYLAALEAFIKVKVFTIKFDTGKIAAPVLQNAQADYAWLSAQLMDTFTIPSVSEMEVITRMWNTLTLDRYEFDNQFKSLGNREARGYHGVPHHNAWEVKYTPDKHYDEEETHVEQQTTQNQPQVTPSQNTNTDPEVIVIGDDITYDSETETIIY